MQDEDIARTIAFFEQSDDSALLQEVLRGVRPRAAAAVRRFQERRRPIPPPREIDAASTAATRDEALDTVVAELEFGQLQAITRAIGRRLEALAAADS
jgi:hypothetical protein